MGIATSVIPNFNAALTTGLRLEEVNPVAIIRADDCADLVPWYNTTGLVVLPGEPIIHNGLVCISVKTILPGKVGYVYRQWVADFWVGTLAADVLVNDLVYWDFSAAGPYTGSGAAVRAAPTNGFILGRAGINMFRDPVLNGSSKPISLATGTYARTALRVNSVPMYPPTTFGTIGVYA